MKPCRGAMRGGVILMAAALLCPGCSLFLTKRVERYAALAPRDAETGIMVGMNAVEVGPTDATRAALLVHGYVGSPNNFGALPEALAARGWRVHAMLVPGHGTSPLDLEKTSVETMRAAVVAEMRRLRAQYDTVVLVGHSMGSTLSVLALEDTAPDALVLASPFFALTYRWFYILPPDVLVHVAAEPLRWTHRAPERRPVRDRSTRTLALAYEWIPTRPGPALLAAAKEARDPARLAGVTVPTLVLHGRHDTVASPRAAQRAYEALGSMRKRMVWLKNSDHVAFWDYDREEAVTAVLDFLAPLENAQ